MYKLPKIEKDGIFPENFRKNSGIFPEILHFDQRNIFHYQIGIIPEIFRKNSGNFPEIFQFYRVIEYFETWKNSGIFPEKFRKFSGKKAGTDPMGFKIVLWAKDF